MIRVKTGIRSEEVRRQNQHVLFVEGKDEDAVDPKALNELFEWRIRIEPLGPSYSVRSVAEALFRCHPTYYFLIDRDHYEDEYIDRCWNNFPDPETHNLLIWRRREIENYFLEPEYLVQSEFCAVGQDELKRKILQCAGERVFLDAANQVVTSIREEFKQTGIRNFTNPADFSSKEAALRKLKSVGEFNSYCTVVAQKISVVELERRFQECLAVMTGGQDQIIFGAGKWLHMIRGKKILAQVVNSNCFQVRAADGTLIDGREKINEIVKGLLKKERSAQPDDFIALKTLIETRTNEV